MATFQKRKKKDGSFSFRAIIRIYEQQEVVHSESKTFAKLKDAKLWATNREAQLNEGGRLPQSKITVKELIEEYEKQVKPIKNYGRSKEQVLAKWKARDEGATPVTEVNSKWVVDFCRMRRTVEHAGPSTVNCDVIHLRSVFSVARDVLGVDVGVEPFDAARPTLTKLNLATRGGERDRRPDVDEITAIVKHAHTRKQSAYYRKGQAPIDKILVFQMFSGRRIGETCRLLWPDLDRSRQMVLVRDMKDPQEKVGNDVWCYVPDEAWAVLLSMPQIEGEDRIFPYNEKSVASTYRRYRDLLGFSNPDDEDENLCIHDLRHECLSWLAEKNGLDGEHWDIPRIQLVSGHKNWNVLQRYVNLLTERPLDKWAKWEWKTKVLEG